MGKKAFSGQTLMMRECWHLSKKVSKRTFKNHEFQEEGERRMTILLTDPQSEYEAVMRAWKKKALKQEW